jgi:hypothetical protein
MHWLTIYKKSSIPAEGWIQQCFMCYRPTSYTVDYKKDEFTHTVYLCKCCQRENNDAKIKNMYITYVEEYITHNTPQPFAVPKIALSPPKIVASLPLSEDLPRPHTIHSKSHTNPVDDISLERQSSIPPRPPPLHLVPYSPPPPIPPIKLPEIPVSPASRQIPVYTPTKTPAPQKSIYDSLFDSASKKLSAYIRKFTHRYIYKPVEPKPPAPR